MGHCDAASTAPTQCAQGNPLPTPPLMNLPIAPCSDAKSYQFFRARIRCVPRFLGKLQEEVKRRRAKRGTWTQTAWKKEVAVMATMDWGTSTHGGRRKRAGNLLKKRQGPQLAGHWRQCSFAGSSQDFGRSIQREMRTIYEQNSSARQLRISGRSCSRQLCISGCSCCA